MIYLFLNFYIAVDANFIYFAVEADMSEQKSSSALEDYDIVAPEAGALIESLRAFGYTPQAAIADLIDNSITAAAKNIWIRFTWNGADSHMSLCAMMAKA